MLNQSQEKLLGQSKILKKLSTRELEVIVERQEPEKLSDEELLEFLQIANFLYRSGQQLVSDQIYDHVFLAELEKRHPEHPFLTNVEPEPSLLEKTVPLPERMLSTEKAYNKNNIKKWLIRIKKAAEELNTDFEQLIFKATPKLDGYAAYDDGKILYTRGDGRKGTDISRVFDRGLVVAGNGFRGQGAGEIVVSREYFNQHLAKHFENARNFQASIIKEKELDEHALVAIQKEAAVFYPFSQLPFWQGTADQILENFDSIIDQVYTLVDYDVDGVVFEVTDETIKQSMGATRHHHRWQIAFKSNVEKAAVKVLNVIPQTSRSGRVNPVAELEPTKLSGAMISRATAHHYGMVKKQGIGIGTLIELTRSGLVIPKIERVIKPAKPQIPETCPSCGSRLVWDNDYLYCLNKIKCPAQIETTMEHFFKTLGNVDGFGHKTIEKLHADGIKSVYQIYQLTLDRLISISFGEKTSQNLLDQLHRSRTEAIEDWRFLGAFGIYRMGLGNCERLLQNFKLNEIFSLTIEDVIKVEGFAEKTAEAIIDCFSQIETEFKKIYQLGFNLIETELISETRGVADSPITGKTIVFTGTMLHGSREDMKKQAKQLGAKVAASVTGNTDLLVTGEKVGTAKITSAKDKGVRVISEAEYFNLIK